jgi:hypothetical protein
VSDRKTAHLVSSGPGADGVDADEFTICTAPLRRIAALECNGESGVAIEAMSQASPCEITITGHGLSDGDYIQINSITQADWIGCVSGQVWQITKTGDDAFTIPFDASEFETAYNAGTDGGTINTIPVRISAVMAIR